MQQRASIARALSFEPALLLMDEPFGALDEIVRDHLNEQLLRLWNQTKKTVVFVTHSIPEAVFLSTKIVVMSPRPGRVIDIVDCNFPRETARWRFAKRRTSSESRSECARACVRVIPMTSSTLAPARPVQHVAGARPVVRLAPVAVIVLALIAVWYVAAVLMNLSMVRDAFERDDTHYTIWQPHCRHLGGRPAVVAGAASNSGNISATTYLTGQSPRRAVSYIIVGLRCRRPFSALCSASRSVSASPS